MEEENEALNNSHYLGVLSLVFVHLFGEIFSLGTCEHFQIVLFVSTGKFLRYLYDTVRPFAERELEPKNELRFAFDVTNKLRRAMTEFQTVLITATALLCHIQRIYPIGAGGDAWLEYYQPNFTSVCFVLGVSLLLSSKELWPSALRRPSQPIMFCYLALVSAFTVSVTLRTVWLPLTLSIAKSNFWLARKIKTTKSLKKMWLLKMAKVLESQSLQNIEVTLVAIIFLHYSLKASGIYNELLQSAYSSKSEKPCIGRAKSGNFSPKVSDSFVSFAMRRKH